jgi:hypothetical protein
MLRHSNSQTTLDIYTQGVDKHRLAAQELMMAAVIKPAQEMVQKPMCGDNPGREIQRSP